jgi:ABC-type Zn uptake system ZnuABC Zn-binding protein ZnuA
MTGTRPREAPRRLFVLSREHDFHAMMMRVPTLVVLAFALAGPGLAGARLNIVATTTDLASLAQAVGGERITVTSLVPPNLDPEEYQPKPQDMSRLKDAQVVVRVGLDFDAWFDRLLTQAALAQGIARAIRRGQSSHVDASFAIAVLDVRGASAGVSDGHAHGSGNPHYWLDPKNAEIITGNILETLAHVDPQNAAFYEGNRREFLARLDAKLREWEEKMRPVQSRPMIAYHNSWAYLARRFRLNFLDVIEPKPGVAPSPARLGALLRTMRENRVHVIVREPHEPERDVLFLAAKTGAAVAVLAGSVGALPGAVDYLSLFDADVAALSAIKSPP